MFQGYFKDTNWPAGGSIPVGTHIKVHPIHSFITSCLDTGSIELCGPSNLPTGPSHSATALLFSFFNVTLFY